jgi:exopolysaccharide biosynthesis polyprenyl glycosylphosphotransferase
MALGDLLLVILVFLLGYWLRHYLLAPVLFELFGMTNDFRLGFNSYLLSGAVMGVIEVIMLQAFGVYRQTYGLAHLEEMAWILRSSFMAVVITFAFTFATRQLYFSRFVLLFAFPAASLAVAVWHWFYRRMARKLSRSRERTIRALVVGAGPTAGDVGSFMADRSPLPYRLAGFIRPSTSSEEQVVEDVVDATDVIGWALENSVEEIVVADPTMDRSEVAGLIYECERHDIAYKLVADIFALVSLTTRVVHLGGTTMIESVPPPLSGSRLLVKRAVDLLIAVPLTLLLLPAGLLISLAIVIDTGFPVFYRQTRLGRDNRPFTILKFRSMRVGADRERKLLEDRNEASGPLFKIRSDPRVTRVGGFLRKWSLDELPQLLNVLSGRMSLVGPRPPLPEEVDRYSQRQLKRLRALPGITGVWQVSGRSELGFDDMVKLDLYYVDNWSIWMDLSIMLLTLPAVVSSRGAY